MLVNSQSNYDLVVIGGGINGTGIAADAAGRGLNVLLCEQGDLAQGTSSASSKLIHGGLRYLEQFEFRMVRESLREREILLKTAPHLVHPIRFIMPYHKNLRSPILIRLGLFLYDFLGGSTKLQRAKVIDLENNPEINPLNLSLKKGFIFSDCTVNDARLVVLNAIRAKQYHATILTRTKLIDAQRVQDAWTLTLEDQSHATHHTISAKVLVNAAGPWVDLVNQDILHPQTQYKLKLVQGSHIVLPRLYEGEQGYFLQNKDRRVLFVVPYQNQFTMVGTTDVPFKGDLEHDKLHITEEEIGYLLESVNQYFHHSIKSTQILSSWSGVRALVDTGMNTLSSVSREYKIECLHSPGTAPLINIFGGKITTYRHLSQEVMHHLKAFFPNLQKDWTATTPLPGGDIKGTFGAFVKQLQKEFPFLPKELCDRYAHYYGTLCYQFLKDKNNLSDLGQCFGANLYEAEVQYLVDHEWARTVEDILYRRTKLGLFLSLANQAALENWLSKAENNVHHG